VSIAGLLERSSEDLPAAEEEVTELRLRLPINLLDALDIHAQGWRTSPYSMGFFASQAYSGAPKQLEGSCLGVSDKFVSKVKRQSPTKWRRP
jgi:hypothetical protein